MIAQINTDKIICIVKLIAQINTDKIICIVKLLFIGPFLK